MAIPDIDTTVGGASSNSFVSIEEADTFLDSRLNSDAWSNALPDNRKRAVLMAGKRLDVENWLGSRATTTQRLAWPRLGVQKVDPIGVGYSIGLHGSAWGGYGEQYTSTEIPQPVKDAQCELALAYLEGFDDGQEDAVESFTEDGVTMKFRSQRPHGELPPRVLHLIGALIEGLRLTRG